MDIPNQNVTGTVVIINKVGDAAVVIPLARDVDGQAKVTS
jgi:hypothetical protein